MPPWALRLSTFFAFVRHFNASLSCFLFCQFSLPKPVNPLTSVLYIATALSSLSCISLFLGDKDGSKVTTVVATPGQGPDRPQEVSYTDTKVIGNGSFGVVYQAKLCDSGELVAIKKVLQDKRFKVKHPKGTFQLLSSLQQCNQTRVSCCINE